MATLWAAFGAQNIDDQWCNANDGVQDTTAQAADDLIIDNGAAAVTFNVDATHVSITITTGSLTLNGDRTFTGNLQLNGGTLADGGNELSMAGDFVYASGTYTSTGAVRLTASANLAWFSSSQKINHLVQDDGVTTTFTGTVKVKKATLGTGVITGVQQFNILPAANDFLIQDSAHTLGCNQLLISILTNLSNGAINGSSLTSKLTLVASNDTLMLTGGLDLGTVALELYGDANTRQATIDMASSPLTVGNITLGDTAIADKRGNLDLGTGFHAISGAVVGGNAANQVNNSFDFALSQTRLTGSINGALIDNFTNTSAIVLGGDIDNVDLTGQTPLLHIYYNSTGAGNTNVTEIAGLPGGRSGFSAGVTVGVAA